ncbi:MAG: ABC transporter substrate-binding protein [Alphaproteobacteria bacterium]|nr:ABC transporter substrate-binding protein [Alphaproteobacteria bacterium]
MAFRTVIKTIIALILPIAMTFGATSSLPTTLYKIGVIQVIEHPALDATCKGIRDELTQLGFKENLQWSWDSAQGNPALATQVAQKFVGQEVHLLIGIGTTAAQAALSASRDRKIPVVFASVTDPKGAKIMGNVTGVSNFVPPKDQFDVIMKILPNAQKIGVVYNPGEANSASLLTQMQDDSKKKGLELVPAAASKTSEVTSAAQSLIGKVDAIFINNDNTALAAINGIGQICRDNKIPLFASDGNLIESGALALLGADQYEIGRQTGRMIAKILRGEAKASDLQIEYPANVNVDLNNKIAESLGIKVPESLKKKLSEQSGGGA